MFRHARTEGFIDQQNPMRDVSLAKSVRRKKFQRDTYMVREVLTMLEYLSPSPGH